MLVQLVNVLGDLSVFYDNQRFHNSIVRVSLKTLFNELFLVRQKLRLVFGLKFHYKFNLNFNRF